LEAGGKFATVSQCSTILPSFVFDALPDRTYHLAMTTLTAPVKKVVVRTKNKSYQRVAR
jgi:hypothetical protein